MDTPQAITLFTAFYFPDIIYISPNGVLRSTASAEIYYLHTFVLIIKLLPSPVVTVDPYSFFLAVARNPPPVAGISDIIYCNHCFNIMFQLFDVQYKYNLEICKSRALNASTRICG